MDVGGRGANIFARRKKEKSVKIYEFGFSDIRTMNEHKKNTRGEKHMCEVTFPDRNQ